MDSLFSLMLDYSHPIGNDFFHCHDHSLTFVLYAQSLRFVLELSSAGHANKWRIML